MFRNFNLSQAVATNLSDRAPIEIVDPDTEVVLCVQNIIRRNLNYILHRNGVLNTAQAYSDAELEQLSTIVVRLVRDTYEDVI
jgi:hypothetical protein